MRLLWLLSLIIGLVAALSSRTTFQYGGQPRGWQLVEPARPTDQVHLIFALKQQNLDQLDRTFWEVSNPKSPRYGKYLSMEAVNKMVAPSQETVTQTLAFLSNYPVSINHYNDYIEVDCTVAVAEQMLSTRYLL